MSVVEENTEPVKKKKGGKKAAIKRLSNESTISEMEVQSTRSTRSNAPDLVSKPVEVETKRTLRSKKENVLETLAVEVPKKITRSKNVKVCN